MKLKTPEEIYFDLRNKIISLFYAPGQLIKEEKLATHYKVSRTPIRGVIARLVQDGLLTVIPKRGTYVSKIEVKGVDDQIFFRKATELHVIDLIKEDFDPKKFSLLKDILARQKEIMEMPVSEKKSDLFFENDNKFHAYLFEMAGKKRVWETMNNSLIALNRMRIIANLRKTSHIEFIYKHHELMLEQMISGDFEGAKKTFIEHLDYGFVGTEDIISKYNNYFIQ